MSDKLRIAIAGLGRIGWGFHFQKLSRSADFELVAVADPIRERLAEARSASGCRGYESFDSLCERESLDAVVIATPTARHETMTLQALRRGWHVVLEKPMATSLSSADRMIAESKKRKRKILVYQPHRLTPEAQTAKEIIGSGILGRIYLIRRSSCRYTRRSDWQSLRRNSGGMLNNYGAHFLDQLIFLSDGSPIEEVQCHLVAAATAGDAEDVVKAWLKTGNGQLLELEINQATAYTEKPWTVCGSCGTMIMEGEAFQVKYFDPKKAPPLEVVDGAAPGRSYDLGDRLPWKMKVFPIRQERQLDFYQNVHEVLVRKARPHIRVEECREVVRIIEECRKKAGSGWDRDPD